MATIAREISIGWGVSGVTLGYTLYKQDGTSAQTRTSSGVTEDGTSAYYSVRPTFNSTWGSVVTVRWDDGTTANVVRETIPNPAYASASAVSGNDAYVGTVEPAGTIVGQFRSITTDLSVAGYVVRVYRNASTTAATATITGQTSTSLGYSYALSGYAASDTIRVVLVDGSGNVLAQQRWGVATASGGGGGGATADEVADAVESRLAGRSLVITSPVLADGTIEIVAGDAYEDDRALPFVFAYAGDSLHGATVTLRFMQASKYAAIGSIATPALVVSTLAVHVDGVLTLAFEPTASQTAMLGTMYGNDGTSRYQAQIVATAANVTLWDGKAVVRRRIGAA